MQKINTDEFEEIVYDEEQSALVFFHREGCFVCEGLEDLLVDLEDDYEEKVEFRKVDVEEESELFSRFGLKGVPQVILFQEGSPVKILSGKKDDEEYENAIETFIA